VIAGTGASVLIRKIIQNVFEVKKKNERDTIDNNKTSFFERYRLRYVIQLKIKILLGWLIQWRRWRHPDATWLLLCELGLVSSGGVVARHCVCFLFV
jgi:hypothetical protein